MKTKQTQNLRIIETQINIKKVLSAVFVLLVFSTKILAQEQGLNFKKEDNVNLLLNQNTVYSGSCQDIYELYNNLPPNEKPQEYEIFVPCTVIILDNTTPLFFNN